jgi:hypothetical protein
MEKFIWKSPSVRENHKRGKNRFEKKNSDAIVEVVFERPEGLAQDLKKYQEKEFFVLNKCVCD